MFAGHDAHISKFKNPRQPLSAPRAPETVPDATVEKACVSLPRGVGKLDPLANKVSELGVDLLYIDLLTDSLTNCSCLFRTSYILKCYLLKT